LDGTAAAAAAVQQLEDIFAWSLLLVPRMASQQQRGLAASQQMWASALLQACCPMLPPLGCCMPQLPLAH
jgi:hypothetical protein